MLPTWISAEICWIFWENLLFSVWETRISRHWTSGSPAEVIAAKPGGNFLLEDSTLDACHNVTFQAFADDHRLVGGNGNFDIIAGDGSASGNITFGASANGANPGVNDQIVQGAGFIHMNANGGNIGSSAHEITLVTGHNAFEPVQQGVTQAGDIQLNAGHNITIKSATIISSGASAFTAVFNAHAGNNFTAFGNIDVFANAHGADADTMLGGLFGYA